MSWLVLTITAAILQAFRNLEQKNLNKRLDALTVSWSRFILPLPLCIAAVWSTYASLSSQFFWYCFATAVFQIGGNILLLKTVKSKNFSIGVVFYKTEILQTAILGALCFGQKISSMGYLAIVIATVGMILMSDISLRKSRLFDKIALMGTLSGFFFAICAFGIRLAAESAIKLGYSEISASITVLMWVIAFQNLIFAVIKLWQRTCIKNLRQLFHAENKVSFLITGLFSFAGSVCWFIAFTIGNVVHVKAVGQVELIVAALLSHLHLRERYKTREAVGMMVTSLAILLLIVYH